MNTIHLDIWLYGPLARYGGSDDNIFAQISPDMSVGSTVRDILAHLGMPSEERGITFINGNLSAMPGLQPDLTHVLADGDRIAGHLLSTADQVQERDWLTQLRRGRVLLR